jgi:hypothetical protein
MLVIVTDSQLISPGRVCHDCLWANDRGEPRWRSGHLGCGHPVGCSPMAPGDRPHREVSESQTLEQNPQIFPQGHTLDPLAEQYECAMGFRLAHIADPEPPH